MSNQEINIEQKNSIKLMRGQRGTYARDIKIPGENMEDILKEIEKVDKILRDKYEKEGKKEKE